MQKAVQSLIKIIDANNHLIKSDVAKETSESIEKLLRFLWNAINPDEMNALIPLSTLRKFKHCPMCGKEHPICDDGDYRVRLYCADCCDDEGGWEEDLLLYEEANRRHSGLDCLQLTEFLSTFRKSQK